MVIVQPENNVDTRTSRMLGSLVSLERGGKATKCGFNRSQLIMINNDVDLQYIFELWLH